MVLIQVFMEPCPTTFLFFRSLSNLLVQSEMFLYRPGRGVNDKHCRLITSTEDSSLFAHCHQTSTKKDRLLFPKKFFLLKFQEHLFSFLRFKY